MEHFIMVKFGAQQQYPFRLNDADTAGLTAQEAQQWLDAELEKSGEEALNPVGKSLLADKVLRLARAAGPGEFARASPWAMQLVRCAAVLIHRANITIDVPASSVGY